MLLLLLLLSTPCWASEDRFNATEEDPCYDSKGRAQRCIPDIANAAFGQAIQVCSAAGCNSTNRLTDLHNPRNATCWSPADSSVPVNLTLRLEKKYELVYIRLQFCAELPPDLSLAVYKSKDYGRTWIPLQYYSKHCNRTFGRVPIPNEQEVLCTDFPTSSTVPRIAFRILKGWPSVHDFDANPVLQDWVTATDVRLMVIPGRQQPVVTVGNLAVGGRCKCNGHASRCFVSPSTGKVRCMCRHNTTGRNCQRCRSFYFDRPWARATAEKVNECVACRCNEHSRHCRFNKKLYERSGRVSGGECFDCQHNTTGPSCQYCRKGYYRDASKIISDQEVCKRIFKKMEDLCEELVKNQTVTTIVYREHNVYPHDPTVWKKLDHVDAIKIFAFITLMVGGLLGNISVILTLVFNKPMRTTINIYIGNLAVADTIICIFCITTHILYIMTENAYVMGAFMCKFSIFTQMTCMICSVLTLSAITFDRFMAIMLPLRARMTKKYKRVVMSVVWIISASASLPFLIVRKHVVNEWKNFRHTVCTENWPGEWYYAETLRQCLHHEPLRNIYYVVNSLTLFFLPVLIMVIAYFFIWWELWIAKVPGDQHATNASFHSKRRKKVNKMILIVLVVFAICWTPFQAMFFYVAFKPNKADEDLPKGFLDFEWFAYYIAYANSFMNPLIYSTFNKYFRQGFFKVLLCGYSRDVYKKSAPPKVAFTEGVTVIPSPNTSPKLNGAHKSTLQGPPMEMELKHPVANVDISPGVEETCTDLKKTGTVT